MGIFIYAGIIGGLLSGIVKLGWEVMFPPRTPERNATNPPQELLQQLYGIALGKLYCPL